MKPKTALSPSPPDAPVLDFAGLRDQYARLKPEIDARIRAVLEHGRFIMGPEVGELEAALAAYAGCRHAVAVSSGTDALLIALMAEDVGPGDAVFLPAFTFTATAEVVALLGARPVFVDVDAGTFNMDPADLARRVEETAREGAARPRAVVAVDLFGLPADYPAIAAVCETHGLFLLADGAQSFGAALHGRRVGALAPATATSFFPAKPLGCYGDGGALLTDDEARAARYRSIRLHGRGEAKYDIVRLGLNARLDTLQAAILLAKLTVIDDERADRARNAALYDAGLTDAASAGALTLPKRVPGAESAWAQYTIQVKHRDRVAAALKDRGVPTAVYYPRPLHLQPAYAQFGQGPGALPVSESLSARVLSLPVHAYLDEGAVARVCAAVVEAL